MGLDMFKPTPEKPDAKQQRKEKQGDKTRNFVTEAWSEEERHSREEALENAKNEHAINRLVRGRMSPKRPLEELRLLQEAKQLLPYAGADKVWQSNDPMHYVGELFRQDTGASPLAISSILSWIESLSDEKRTRGAVVERELRSHLERGETLNLAGIISLPEIESAQGASLFAPSLTIALYENGRIEGFEKYFTALNRLNDPEGNVIVHKILDTCQMFWESYNNITPNDEEYYDLQRINAFDGPPTFSQEASALTHAQRMYATNYLVEKHIQDAIDSIELWTDKPEALSGSPGGSSDKTIYTFRRLQESYDLRRELGVWEGYLIGNPVLPIAPGYSALYNRLGKIEKVYHAERQHKANQRREEDRINIGANDREHEWIYDALNVPAQRGEDPSRGLQKLRPIWNLSDDLKAEDSMFYFDTTKINMDGLHGMVRGDLLHRNFEYLKSIHGANSEIEGLPLDKIQDLLFPAATMGGAAEMYLYGLFSSLGMRKKIEDEFGIHLEQLSFPAQAQFISMLNTRTEKQFEEVRKFSNTFGIDGLRTFLVTANDESLRERVFDFAASVPKEDAEVLFKTYGDLVGSIDKVGDYLREAFGYESAEAVNVVVEKQLDRARKLLSDAYENKAEPEKLLRLINNANAENALFLDAYKAIKAENPTLRFEDIPAVQSTIMPGRDLLANDKLLGAVEKMYGKNARPGTADVLLKDFRKSLDDPQAEFSILSHEQAKQSVPVAFMLTTEDKRSVYVSALNAEKEFAGVRPGGILMQRVMNKARTGKVIEATATPDVARAYIAMGCVGDRVMQAIDGAPFFHVRGDSALLPHLQSRNIRSYSPQKLESLVRERFDPEEPIQVFQFKDKMRLFDLETPFSLGFVVTNIVPRGDEILVSIEKPADETSQQLAA